MAPRLPLLFEALPPRLDASQEQWQDHLEILDPLRRAGLWGVNVPEIEGGGEGRYETVEPRSFAASLQRHLGVRAILNRITVHHTLAELQSWTTQTRMGSGIRDLVLVGGESSTAAYPGASVLDALSGLHPGVAKAGGELGVITIPTRRRPIHDEPDRLLAKQAAGATFAVSQILCESEAALRLQRDLAERARQADAPTPLVLWSLAPVARRRDLEFLAWLGVDVPEAHRQWILEPPSPAGRLERSHQANEAMARRLLEAAEAAGSPTGFSLEHVMLSNIEAALELVERIRTLGREFSGVARPVPSDEAAATAW
ncbi:MAG: hypothetical protein ACYDBQ_08245 [Thermoplasmatota archaeon]